MNEIAFISGFVLASIWIAYKFYTDWPMNTNSKFKLINKILHKKMISKYPYFFEINNCNTNICQHYKINYVYGMFHKKNDFGLLSLMTRNDIINYTKNTWKKYQSNNEILLGMHPGFEEWFDSQKMNYNFFVKITSDDELTFKTIFYFENKNDLVKFKLVQGLI